MTRVLRAPPDLRPAGKRLWRELTSNFAFDRGETAGLAELCRIGDRLAEVRETLAREGLVGTDGKRHPLADLEPKLSGQFRMLWRTLRLDVAEESKK